MEWKHHDKMTVEEARDEYYWLEEVFASCAKYGDGISTKDSIRHRACKAMIDLHDKVGVEPKAYQDMEGGVLEFMRQGREMFAPAEK